MSSASGDLPPVAALDLGADATALPRPEDAGSVGASAMSTPSSRWDHYSRQLTKLLRHGVHKNGLGSLLSPDGYLPLDAVLQLL